MLHVPETLPDGLPVPHELLDTYEDQLLDIAAIAKAAADGVGEEGFTLVAATGVWRSCSRKTHRESILRYELDVADAWAIRRPVEQLAQRIAEDLAQEMVYVTVSPLDDGMSVIAVVPA
jgi:hypothetical protein